MLFRDFLEKYIEDYIECSDKEYNLTQDQINDIAYEVSNDEYVWEAIEGAIDELLPEEEED